MSRLVKILLVGFILGFELIFIGTYNPYPHGEIVDVRYRGKERLTAYMNYHINPSPTTEAKFKEELSLMHKHEDWKTYATLGVLFTFNVIGVYYFLRQPRQQT